MYSSATVERQREIGCRASGRGSSPRARDRTIRLLEPGDGFHHDPTRASR